jgi:hypothetical protein
MKIYLSNSPKPFGVRTPIVIETNLAYAIPYWTKRKRANPKIYWEFA